MDLGADVVEFLLGLLGALLHFAASSLELVLLVADLHDLAGGALKVLLQLLQLATLLKETLGGRATLVLKNLFALQIGTLGTLNELVAVVLVAHLQVVKCVRERLDFLLALADLAVQLVTIPLKLFLFLGSLDHEISLSVLSVSLNVPGGRLVALHKTFILNAQVLDLLGAELQFDGDLVALLLGSLLLALENVLVDLDLLLALIHGHLQLVLAVFKAVDFVRFHIDDVAQVLNLKLHNVVLHEGLLLLVGDLSEIYLGQLVN